MFKCNSLQPAARQMLVTIEEQNKQGALYLPNSAHKDYRIGTIQRLGPEVNTVTTAEGIVEKPCPCKLVEGDRVVLNTYHGFPIKVGDVDMVLMPSDAVFARIDK